MPKLTAEQDSLVPAEMTLRKQANEMPNQHPVVFCGNTMRGDTVDYCWIKFIHQLLIFFQNWKIV